jgi:hypothetical protein
MRQNVIAITRASQPSPDQQLGDGVTGLSSDFDLPQRRRSLLSTIPACGRVRALCMTAGRESVID